MSTSTIETIIVALAAIVFVTYRQTRWQTVGLSRLLQMPVILGVAGLVTIRGTIQHLPHGWQPTTTDIVVLLGELVAGLVAGVLIGRLAILRTENGVLRTRLGGAGLAVWLGFLGLRIGLEMVAALVGASFAAQPGVTLLVVAVIKLVQALVVWERASRHRAEESRRAYALSGF